MKIKRIIATFSAVFILTANAASTVCSAAPEETANTTTSSSAITTTEAVTTAAQNIPDTTVDWQKLQDDYQEAIKEELEQEKKNSIKNPVDYYNDPYYDTDGNATLIDTNEYDVIYSDAKLLFTAVTTKDGHVFYIIINYDDKDGDNVYFLNKVDDYDLYSLLSSNSNTSSSSSSSENKNTVEEYISQKSTTTANNSNDSETTTSAATASKSGTSKLKLIFILGIVVLIGAAGFILPKFMDRSKKNKVNFEDDELEEIDETNEY